MICDEAVFQTTFPARTIRRRLLRSTARRGAAQTARRLLPNAMSDESRPGGTCNSALLHVPPGLLSSDIAFGRSRLAVCAAPRLAVDRRRRLRMVRAGNVV